MKTIRKGLLGVVAGAWLAATANGAYVVTNFDSYATGQAFTSLLDQWKASTNTVTVSTAQAFTLPKSIEFAEAGMLSNHVAVVGPAVVWTTFRTIPFLGPRPLAPPTNAASTLLYFDDDGFVELYAGGAWLVCSNDVWGQPVAPADGTNWVEISIYQNYLAQTQAVMIGDQLAVQDLPFAVAHANYGDFAAYNAASNTYLDDVWIQTAYDAARHAQDLNLDGVVDANELQAYGYASRTLYVGGGGYPSFASIQDALNVARDRDRISVPGGSYSETLVVNDSVHFIGSAFTNSGSLTVNSGVSVSFAQSVKTTSATLDGSVAMASGTTLDVPTLAVNGAGRASFTNARLVSVSADVDQTGTFVVDSAWGTPATVGLPFIDNFDGYAAAQRIDKLGFKGWGATDAGVVAQAGVVQGGIRASLLPGATMMSNRISTVAAKIWTDFYTRPVTGDRGEAPTNTAAFAGFADSNGYFNVAWAGTWLRCTNNFVGGAAPTFSSSAWTRVTIMLDYGQQQFAALVNDQVVQQQKSFPGSATAFHTLAANNADPYNSMFLDGVYISTTMPSGLTNDLDADGIADALELDMYGSTFGLPRVSIFKFR